MAIFVEQEEKPTNWVAIAGFAAVLGAIFLGGYFLFFKKPELIEVIVPERLQTIEELAAAKFDPQGIVDSAIFKLLKDYAQPLVAPSKGRANPFKSL